jgi:hypothetical protein
MTTNNQLRLPLLLIALITFIAVPIAAQSPNTATMIVAVFDQAGAVVKDAKVLAVNTATGAVREVASGSDGTATIQALSLTGSYTVSVSREGFGVQELKDITLRSGETATWSAPRRRRLSSTAPPKACARIRRSAAGSTGTKLTRRRSSAAR